MRSLRGVKSGTALDLVTSFNAARLTVHTDDLFTSAHRPWFLSAIFTLLLTPSTVAGQPNIPSSAKARYDTSEVSRARGAPDDRYSDLTAIRLEDPKDLDGNGIPDSVDTRHGYAHDVNRNGIIDPFEPEAVPGSFDPVETEWERAAQRSGKLDMVRLFSPYVGYSIRCFLPRSLKAARLVVRALDGRELAVVSECVGAGASSYYWPLRGKHGLPLPIDAEYRLCLESDSRSIRHLVRWRRPLLN